MSSNSVSLSPSPSQIPITVFTGFLGAGKTSIILSLLPQLPSNYRVVLLKNEFGDIEVDSQLAKQSSLTAVSEILNGCMCCVLVGQMKTALLEILEKYHPDRIIIESSGSAFPATLAFQIRELERDTSRALTLDAIVTVIDAENFSGYEDTSITARMQAQYTDVLLINKWEHVSERALDDVLEHLNTLNEYTPKIRCSGKSVDPALIFSIDSKLFRDPQQQHQIEGLGKSKGGGGGGTTQHHDEVETLTLLRSSPLPAHAHEHVHTTTTTTTTTPSLSDHHLPHTPSHPDEPKARPLLPQFDEPTLTAALHQLPKESVYRVKGFILFAASAPAPTPPSGTPAPVAVTANADSSRPWWILNWAFGRWELVRAPPPPVVIDEDDGDDEHGVVRLTVMGERGEVRRYAERLAEALGAAVV